MADGLGESTAKHEDDADVAEYASTQSERQIFGLDQHCCCRCLCKCGLSVSLLYQ